MEVYVGRRETAVAADNKCLEGEKKKLRVKGGSSVRESDKWP
jgi:hypothetical protein